MKVKNIFISAVCVFCLSICITSCTDRSWYQVADITLNKTTLELTEGDSEKLEAVILPVEAADTPVVWESSDVSIATADYDGTVHALASGEAVITIRTEDNHKSASCALTVIKKTIKPDGITLTKEKTALLIGGEETLSAVVTPDNADNKNVIWSTSDSTIAQVDKDGKVTGKAEGEAVITAETEDRGLKAACTVTVAKEKIDVTGVILDKETLTLYIGETAALNAQILPENATDQNVTWESSDAQTAAVSEAGLVSAVQEGTADITVTTKDGEKKAVCKVTVKRKVAIVFEGTNDETIPLSVSGLSNEASISSTSVLQASVTGTWDSYTWYLDGAVKGNTSSISLSLSGEEKGTHTLTLVVVKDGKPYSKSVMFKIIE